MAASRAVARRSEAGQLWRCRSARSASSMTRRHGDDSERRWYRTIRSTSSFMVESRRRGKRGRRDQRFMGATVCDWRAGLRR